MSDIRKVVKEKYGQAALRVVEARDSGCGPSCCSGGAAAVPGAVDPITVNLYDAVQTEGLPAEAVLASPDALPVGEILRAVTPVESELLRILLLVPSAQLRAADELAPNALPSTVARELYRAVVLMRAPDDHGVHPPFDRERLLGSLDDETRALALALYAQSGPDPRDLPEHRVHYAIESCLLGLEADRIEERSEWNLAQQAEAERNGDAAEMQRLLAQERQINEERRSLDRRRDQARLLTRPMGTRP